MLGAAVMVLFQLYFLVIVSAVLVFESTKQMSCTSAAFICQHWTILNELGHGGSQDQK